MEFTPMRLLVYAVVAIALIYVFMNYFLPYFFPQQNALDAIENGIMAAETGLGKAVGGNEIIFPKGMGISGESFDKRNRYVTFSCDNPEYCCAIGQDVQERCRVLVDQSTHRNAQFKELARAETYFRCGYESNLYTCRVYLGGRPAQVEIADVEFKDEFDLSTEDVTVKFTVKDSGELPAFDVVATANVYSIEKDETGREVENFYKGPFHEDIEKIDSGEEKAVEFKLDVLDGGRYVLKLRAEAFDAGFDEQEIRFETTSPLVSKNCQIDRIGESYSEEGICKTKQYCKNCDFAYECELRWFETGIPLDSMELADPAFTYLLEDAVDSTCDALPAVQCAPKNKEDAKLESGECKRKTYCENCKSAEECKDAWLANEVKSYKAATKDYAYELLNPSDFPACKATPAQCIGYTNLTAAIEIDGIDLDSRVRGRLSAIKDADMMKSKEKQYDSLINEIANEKGLDPALIKAVIAKESSYNSNAKSGMGTMGLMQVAPEGKDWSNRCHPFPAVKQYDEDGDGCLTIEQLWKPEINIRLGADILNAFMKYPQVKNCEAKIPLALALYNGGSRVVGDCKIKNDASSETREYPEKVLAWYAVFCGESAPPEPVVAEPTPEPPALEGNPKEIIDIIGVECSPNVVSENRCKLTREAVNKLLEVKAIAEKMGRELYITSAYRSVDLQRILFRNAVAKYGSEAKARKYVAKPSPTAPHATGGAVDLCIKGSVICSGFSGAYANHADAKLLEQIMCEAGWVRYVNEWWHFEYGTKRWDRGQAANSCSA